MPQLTAEPGTSTAKQRRALVLLARNHGIELEQLRESVGSSLHALSAAQASEWIQRFSGRDLPNPPGRKPRPYGRRRSAPGVVRIITDDHIEQIINLGLAYFDVDACAFLAWLSKNFKVPFRQPRCFADLMELVRPLGTAERAGQVIRVLKQMLARREASA